MLSHGDGRHLFDRAAGSPTVENRKTAAARGIVCSHAWELNHGARTDYVLVAVLRFDKPSVARLIAGLPSLPGSPPEITSTDNRPWLPAPVRAVIGPRDAESVTVRGLLFDAAPFLTPRYATG